MVRTNNLKIVLLINFGHMHITLKRHYQIAGAGLSDIIYGKTLYP